MICTSHQLKALVRNMSSGNSAKAQLITRNYAMERFLERLSLSRYRDNLILKGGALVAAMVGLDQRSTLDVDATVKNLPLSEIGARRIVEEITSVQIEDGLSFTIKSVSSIMDDADYPGIRIMLEAVLENMRTPLKIDFSTDDVITPREVTFSLRMLFEERTISILAYNLETVLAEKLETVIARSTANTRMRDFYDIYVLTNSQTHSIDNSVLKRAFANTSEKRGTIALKADADLILSEIEKSTAMIDLWSLYQNKYEYAEGLSWEEVMLAVRRLADAVQWPE